MNDAVLRSLFEYRDAAYKAMHSGDLVDITNARGKAAVSIGLIEKKMTRPIILTPKDLADLVKHGALRNDKISIEVVQ